MAFQSPQSLIESYYNSSGNNFSSVARDQYNTQTNTTNQTTNHSYHYDHAISVEQLAREGLQILYDNVAPNAFYNSGERHPQPRCHPGTREEILKKLCSWVEGAPDGSAVVFFWLYGSAGVGKSAIAQTICEKYARDALAAHFFFSRNDPSRDSLRFFIPTIAYQLATSEPFSSHISDSFGTSELGQIIGKKVWQHPEVLSADLDTQFRMLIQEPCRELDQRSDWDILPSLVVIDGLDECLDAASQERLIKLLGDSCTTDPPLPFHFIICSRPEPRIRTAFDFGGFDEKLDRMGMGQSYEADRDIEKYLRDAFGNVRQRNRHIMADVDPSWPGDKAIHQLVQRAQGQFIFAATVIKFVDMTVCEDMLLPHHRLAIVLSLKWEGVSSSPYPDLDMLYCEVLRFCPWKNEDFKKILQLILTNHYDPEGVRSKQDSPSTRSQAVIASMVNLTPGQVGLLPSRLHSVLDIPDMSGHGDITVLHASFSEFLEDPARSKEYCVQSLTPPQYHALLSCSILKSVLARGEFDHSYRTWPHHLLEALSHWSSDPLLGCAELTPALQMPGPSGSSLLRLLTYAPLLRRSSTATALLALHKLYLFAKANGLDDTPFVHLWASLFQAPITLAALKPVWLKKLTWDAARYSMALGCLRIVLPGGDSKLLSRLDSIFQIPIDHWDDRTHLKVTLFSGNERPQLTHESSEWLEFEPMEVTAEDVSSESNICLALPKESRRIEQLMQRTLEIPVSRADFLTLLSPDFSAFSPSNS